MGRHVYNCQLAIFWKFNSVPDVSNLLKLPTPILLEVSLSTMGTVFVRFHFRLRQHIVYFHWSSPFQTYLSISPFTIVFHFLLFLNFRIPITRNLIILFFLPLLSSTLPKSELRAAITTISTYDHSKVSPSKNEEKSPTAALSVTYTFENRPVSDFQEGHRWYMTLAACLLGRPPWGPSFGALLGGLLRNMTSLAPIAIAPVYC